MSGRLGIGSGGGSAQVRHPSHMPRFRVGGDVLDDWNYDMVGGGGGRHQTLNIIQKYQNILKCVSFSCHFDTLFLLVSSTYGVY